MDDLAKAFDVIRGVRDCPVVHRLILDCYALALKYGESEGLRYAQMYLNAIKEYGQRQREIAALGRWNKEGGDDEPSTGTV